MNSIAHSYGLTMRSLFLVIIALIAMLAIMFLAGCQGLTLPTALPIDFGVRYQVEPGLYVVATPKDKGGVAVKFEGEGKVSDHLHYDGIAWTYTSPRTGIIYRISEGPTGRPRIEIVGGGTDKLQLVPASEAAKPAT